MKERWKEYQEEVKGMKYSEIPFTELAIWFQQWAIYIAKGGTRPPKPH